MKARLLALAVACLVAAAAAAEAEVQLAPPSTTTETAPPVIPGGPLRLDCWQYGMKIIERGGLRGLQAGAAYPSGWLSFQEGTGEGRVVITPLGEALCVIATDRAPPGR